MPSGKKARAQRRAAAAAPPPVRSKGTTGRPTTARDWLNSRWAWPAAIGGVVLVVVVVGILLATRSSPKPFYPAFPSMVGLQTGPPPWNNGVGELTNRLSDVKLDPLSAEALAFHIHQHLDVYVNGKHVTVPAFVGIDNSSFITEVHTHDSTGIIHVESAANKPYVLGQFFGEWSVRLTQNCLGKYCGNLHWYVDGIQKTGNPADLILRPHQEIVIAAGKPPAHIPKSYSFPAGL